MSQSGRGSVETSSNDLRNLIGLGSVETSSSDSRNQS